jgi:DNA polymerase III epsilon subunit-like protein
MRAPAPIFPNVVYFDLETTGLGKTADIRICEIGMVRASNGEQFQQYVNPTIDVSSSASRVHGLKKEFLSKHASWEHVGAEMNGFLDQGEREVILAGFNSKRYDSRILFFEHDRHNLAFSNSNSNSNHLCFVDFRDIFPHFFKLTGKKTLGAYHEHVTGEPISNAHTAVGDCLALQTIVEHISDTALLYELIAKKKKRFRR